MTLPSAYVSAVLADSPWGFWGMQETTGTSMADLSGNGRSGIYNASAVSVAGPQPGWTGIDCRTSPALVTGVLARNTPMAFEWWSMFPSGWTSGLPVAYQNTARTLGLEVAVGGLPCSTVNTGIQWLNPSVTWVCASHAGTIDTFWTYNVLQLESDGHWRAYAWRSPLTTPYVDDLGTTAMAMPSSPAIGIGVRPGGAGGNTTILMSAFAFYDHALSSSSMAAHWNAQTGPPPGPCQYGTRAKSGTPSAVEVTDAFLQSLLAFFPSFPVGQAFANTIGMHIDSAAICSSPPPTLAPFQWQDIFTLGARALTQLQIMAWWQLCECIPGTPSPITPTPPTPVLEPGYPSDPVYLVNPTNPCLDLTEVRRKLDEILRIVNDDLGINHFVQRQLVPSATASGTPHVGLTGAGSFAVSAAIGAQVVITARPPGGRELEGAPPYIWDAGWLSIMDGNGFIQERRLTRDVEVWMPRLMSDAITFGYYLKDGVIADVTILYALP